MPTEQARQAAENILAQMENYLSKDGNLVQPDASVGSDLFQQVESSDLSPTEKQEVYKMVADGIGEMEMQDALGANQPNTFLRGNNARTRFAADYMKSYAAEYNNAVMDVAFEEVSKVQFDDPAVAVSGVPSPSVRADDARWKPETIQKAKEQYVQFASSVIKATETQMGKLTPDNQQFLQALVKPAQQANQPDAVNAALSSTLLLRNAQPAIMNTCGLLADDSLVNDPQLKQQGQFSRQAAGIVMSYANIVNSPAGEGTGGGIGPLVAQLRTEENVNRTQAIYAALAEGGEALENALQQHVEESPLTLSPAAAQLKEATSGLAEQRSANEEAAKERQAQRQAAQQSEAPGVDPSADNGQTQKSRLTSVRDALRGSASRVADAASALKNTIGDKLSTKGSEQSLKEVRENHPELVEKYKDLQKQMSDLKKQYLEAVDPAKMSNDPSAKIDNIKSDMTKVQEQMDTMKQDNAGLAQLDRSKVGQVVHSGVRDAAKSVGSKLKA